MPPSPQKKGLAKLDSVFEQHQKGLEESINLTSSVQHSNPSSLEQPVQLQQIKEMIK